MSRTWSPSSLGLALVPWGVILPKRTAVLGLLDAAPPPPLPQDVTVPISDLIDMVVKSNRVVAFVKGTRNEPQCGFSFRMLNILNTLKADYEVVNVLDEVRQRVTPIPPLGLCCPHATLAPCPLYLWLPRHGGKCLGAFLSHGGRPNFSRPQGRVDGGRPGVRPRRGRGPRWLTP